MHLVSPLALVFALGCALAPGSFPAGPMDGEDPLAPATKPLAVPADREYSLQDLLIAFADSTGQLLAIGNEARAILAQTPVGLNAAAEVPPEDVYSFVEGLLAHHHVVLALLARGKRPMLGVYPLMGGRSVPFSAWLSVPAEELPRYRDHAALLVQTVVVLPSLDVRQAATSFRGLLRDTDHQTLLATGEHTLVLRGTGRFVADTVAMLEQVARANEAACPAGLPRAGVRGGEDC